MADFRSTHIGVNDAARLLQVRTSELKDVVRRETTLRGVEPPKPIYKTGNNGWVFLAGDVMDVAEKLNK